MEQCSEIPSGRRKLFDRAVKSRVGEFWCCKLKMSLSRLEGQTKVPN